MVKQLLQFLWLAPRKTAILLIRGYQQTLSPDHGPLKGLFPYGCCVHTPTCSQYSRQVMEQRGFVMGSLLTLKRISTCHPWAKPSEEKMKTLL